MNITYTFTSLLPCTDEDSDNAIVDGDEISDVDDATTDADHTGKSLVQYFHIQNPFDLHFSPQTI